MVGTDRVCGAAAAATVGMVGKVHGKIVGKVNACAAPFCSAAVIVTLVGYETVGVKGAVTVYVTGKVVGGRLAVAVCGLSCACGAATAAAGCPSCEVAGVGIV